MITPRHTPHRLEAQLELDIISLHNGNKKSRLPQMPPIIFCHTHATYYPAAALHTRRMIDVMMVLISMMPAEPDKMRYIWFQIMRRANT